ncbi:hypothetical protein GCM10023144_21480 [Pigmentiphaga soli]|uniref:Transmembrane protein n=1 Tax=Pigmentiphaga soli TaxID=1007095 RepID=A0ABP8GZI0_9BURK
MAAFCAVALFVWTAMPAAASESSYAAAQGFRFALLGQTPARPVDEPVLIQTLAQIGSEADLAVHVGAIKGRGERCDDAVYQRRRELLQASPVPLVLTPGDEDWADCDQESGGRFAPVERLNRIRELFFDADQSLGQLQLDLQRQSDTARFRGYPENARWEYGGVVFATFNMPGNFNNFRPGAGRNGEYEDRILANASWLRQAFAAASREKAQALVLAFHANPHFEGNRDDRRAADGRDPYGDFKLLLARLASRFPGQVLVVHASDNTLTDPPPADHPLRLNGRVLANVRRVQTYGSPLSQYWIRIDVAPGRKGALTVTRRTAVLLPPRP